MDVSSQGSNIQTTDYHSLSAIFDQQALRDIRHRVISINIIPRG